MTWGRLRGLFAMASALLVGAGPGVARADEPPAVSALAPPPLTLTVTPPATASGGGPWTLRIENTGDVPLRIAADPRLLVLEIAPPVGTELEATPRKTASKKSPAAVTVTCRLPDDARPVSDDGSGLVVPGKRSWSATFDPLFYCFGPRERRALVKDASVTAHFGWPVPPPKAGASKTKKAKVAAPAPPFVTSPVGAAAGKIAPAKELVGATFVLADAVSGAVPAAADAPPATPGRPLLRVTMPESHDTRRGAEIGTSVTVQNEGDTTALLLFRAETIRFAVAGPQGSFACGGTASVESPIRELYGSIGAKQRASLALLLDAMCPVDSFDEPGIYRVTATLDTTSASARSIGLKTWDGEATARAPLLLRVRNARRPMADKPRPALD
ncbi:MAG: hypothetical protein JWP97_4828 [Labilithrix sp.]|nr:hypothetical protein [Labilithrix sp.]